VEVVEQLFPLEAQRLLPELHSSKRTLHSSC
jgi:hypothetical protein